jgi:hypothetical protein
MSRCQDECFIFGSRAPALANLAIAVFYISDALKRFQMTVHISKQVACSADFPMADNSENNGFVEQ